MSKENAPYLRTNDELIAAGKDAPKNWMTIDELVGSNIKALRVRANLSLRQAADLMTIWHQEGWTYQRFNRRERAEAPVTVTELHAFANLFGVSLFRFLRRPEHIQFLQINGLHLRAEEYELDYLYDPLGRTGEPQRVDLEERFENLAWRARRAAEEGAPLAPGLTENATPKRNLQRLAETMAPHAEQLRQAEKKGTGTDGDDHED
jgi:transcriptional regulator with XRE-family HTH domain